MLAAFHAPDAGTLTDSVCAHPLQDWLRLKSGIAVLSDQTVFLGIRALTLVESGVVLGLLVVGDLSLRAIIARRARRTEAAPVAEHEDGRLHTWLGSILRTLPGPLTLLLWVLGLEFALGAPLAEAELGDAGPRLLEAVRWLRGLGTLIAAVWLLTRLGRLAESRLNDYSRRSTRGWDDILIPVAGSALRLMLPLIAIILAAPALEVAPALKQLTQQALSIALIAVFAFLLLRLIDAACQLTLRRFPLNVGDNLQARAVHTQITVLRKVALVVVGLFALASMLMVFEPVRRFGTTLLASAGVAGIIIGFAAQKSIATLLAGFQLALTQPVRVDDVVIVEGEWGRIEEITLTYVVVAIWDERRLVVPITYFIEKPFQNWTRTTSNLLGTVFLYVDYSVPLEALRAELARVVEASPLWDRRVQLLQVTDSKERTLELRVLLSASNAGRAFDLRCEVREKLISWLQREHPDALPRTRAELQQVETA
jgi:small-conductance mechanosensitive channel